MESFLPILEAFAVDMKKLIKKRIMILYPTFLRREKLVFFKILTGLSPQIMMPVP